jgi:hypothetical protein
MELESQITLSRIQNLSLNLVQDAQLFSLKQQNIESKTQEWGSIPEAELLPNRWINRLISS